MARDNESALDATVCTIPSHGRRNLPEVERENINRIEYLVAINCTLFT